MIGVWLWDGMDYGYTLHLVFLHGKWSASITDIHGWCHGLRTLEIQDGFFN